MHESPYYPYPPRPGVGLETIDFEADRVILTEEETAQVLAFERQLYEVTLDEEAFPSAAKYQQEQVAADTPMPDLESVWRLKVNTTMLGVGYFKTDEGIAALRGVFGPMGEAQDTEPLSQLLTTLDISTLDSKTLNKLEADSVGYEERQATQAFIDNGFKGDAVATPEFVSLYKNPEVIIAKARGYRQLKAYLTHARADLQASADDSPVHAAEMLLAEKYRQRINGFLAGTYVSAYKMLAQYRTSGETAHAALVAELEEILPVFSPEGDNAAIAGFLQRIDRYRHGVDTDEAGNFTWLSAPARRLAAEATGQDGTDADRDVYADIDPDLLASTTIDGATFGKLLSDVVQEYGKLSESTEWDSERTGPAPDNKWQVIVDSKFKSLSVSDKQRIIMVPDKSITLLKAIAVGNHEIAHMWQHENKRALGELAILVSIGLDNSSEQTEAGGMWQESVAHAALSGIERHTVAGTGYLKNIEIKAEGGSFGQCVEAYYDDLMQRNPKMSPDTAAERAVNRARRVFRYGGFEYASDTPYLTNTQPLQYLEQELIYKELDEHQRKLLLVGGITIANLVELSRYGLVDPDKIAVPEKMPWQLMYPAVKKILADAPTQ